MGQVAELGIRGNLRPRARLKRGLSQGTAVTPATPQHLSEPVFPSVPWRAWLDDAYALLKPGVGGQPHCPGMGEPVRPLGACELQLTLPLRKRALMLSGWCSSTRLQERSAAR